MLDLKLLQKNPEIVSESFAKRNIDLNVNDFLELDAKRKILLQESESLKNERNTVSSKIADLKKNGQDCTELINKMGGVNSRIKELDASLSEIEAEQNNWMLLVPNIPDSSVPVGVDENDNVEVLRFGNIPTFDFTPKEHWDLAQTLGGLDFDRGAKLAGSRFTLYWTWAARLERALVNFFLDTHINEHGYLEMLTPLMVNSKTMTGTGNLPKFKEDLFKLENWDYYLIPSSEVSLTNIYSDEVIDEDMLPLGFTAQTPCFRSEAGSHGKDTRGLIRQHQFTKVEMVRYSHPSSSYQELDKMRNHAENLLKKLNLPYRVITLCTGDMGFQSAKTFDIEVWLPGQNTYREISSCSNCEDFQARRANLKFKPKDGGKAQYIHTLNGSGLAVGRTLVAVMENGQQKDGSIIIPDVLIPYMGGIKKITPDLKAAFN